MFIKELRIAKKMTQQQLADATGIDRALIARYENGSRVPPVPKLKIIAEALGVSLDMIAGFDSCSEEDQNADLLLSINEQLSPESQDFLLQQAELLLLKEKQRKK